MRTELRSTTEFPMIEDLPPTVPIIDQVAAIADCSSDLIAVTDCTFQPTYINPAARSFFGLAPDTPARNLDLYSGIDPTRRDQLRRQVSTVLLTGGVWRDEYTLTAPHTGRVLKVAASYSALVSPTGEPLGFAVVCRDTDDAGRVGPAAANDYVFNKAVVERAVLEDELRRAVEQEQLELYFQPAVNPTSRDIRGFEALLRWNHPTRGVLAPGHFLDAVESAGLIGPVGDWTIHAATRALAEFESAGCPATVGINLFSAQLVTPDLIDTLRSAATTAQVDVKRLGVEVSENTLMDDVRAAAPVFADLQAHGIGVSIDDFGTGYSNLVRLRELDVDFIKIDRSLIIGVDDDPRARQLLTAVMGLAEALEVDALAEGVETAEQLAVVESLGCRHVQGFHTGRPMPIGDAVSLLQSTRSAASAQ